MIHLIRDAQGVIFSDGKYTEGKRFWTNEVRAWMVQCHNMYHSEALQSEDTATLISEIEKLNQARPDGIVVDSDTILADLVKDCDVEFNGFSQDIFNIWREYRQEGGRKDVF